MYIEFEVYFQLEVFQEIYVHIDTPSNIIRQEEATIPIYVYNHHNESETITLDITIKFPGNQKPKEDYTQPTINAKNAISHPVKIRSTAIGIVTIKINVFDKDGTKVDGVNKQLLVVAEGVKKRFSSESFPIALGSDGRVTRTIPVNIPVALANMVPDSVEINLSVHGESECRRSRS